LRKKGKSMLGLNRKVRRKETTRRIYLDVKLLLKRILQKYNTMGTGSSFPGVKRQGREDDHSPPTSAEVKKMWIYTSTPPYAFMA
jgi:hypothetical protein